MALTLHYHPLSSFCWKALIALYDCAIAFDAKMVNLGDSRSRADFIALWPTGKMPVLLDGATVVPETSIIIEYLSLHHAAPDRALIPPDASAALEARLLDRVLDLYVMMPMQAIVADRLRAEADRDATAVAKARERLSMAYGLLEQRLHGRVWMAGDRFSLADCAAAPALFYATTLVPLPPANRLLVDYFERVITRPSVARVLQEAQPFFQYYPYKEALPTRFLAPAS